MMFPQGFTNESQALFLESNPYDDLYLDNSTGLLVAAWTDVNVDPSAQSQGQYDVGIGFPEQYVDVWFMPPQPPVEDPWIAAIDWLFLVLPILFFGLFFFLPLALGIRATRKRAVDYFEPKLNRVGAGPRRDLTAVEAAVVLERPIETVATMILFSLMKKDKVRVISDDGAHAPAGAIHRGGAAVRT